jgi:hypothetical protein
VKQWNISIQDINEHTDQHCYGKGPLMYNFPHVDTSTESLIKHETIYITIS